MYVAETGPVPATPGSYPPLDHGIRDSMRVLPAFLALPLTFLTGKPHTGQRAIRTPPTVHLVNALCSMVGGLALSGTALALGGWLFALLPPGWAMTLHGMRNLRMMIFHQCAHRNMWARPRPDRIVGRIICALLLVQHFEEYSTEHVRDHHAVHHMTLRDPTVQAFLLSLELRPGMSRRRMWRGLLGKLASPVFHLRFLSSRVRSYAATASAAERVGAAVFLGLVAALATWLHAWTFVLVAWVLPLTFFYQVSNTLRLCVKHTFPAPDTTERRGKAYFASLTNAIFLGERAPAREVTGLAHLGAWTRWWTRMLLIHFPSRYLVLTGDTVCHDYHHRHPMSRVWGDYVFARAADERSGHRGWPPYREVWGLVPAINAVFDSLSAADPTEFDVARLADVSKRKLYAAFDD
ncbi:fatty acid desaturase [Streptomyces sp. NPDC059002]|uniref:fatty acid desaturase n=1 Tax=Streptomyces sp. NPDC059002 TaxID=3346690 RepID=UPI0036AD5751